MDTYYDESSRTHERIVGKNGASYVMLVDQTGVPNNSLPVSVSPRSCVGSQTIIGLSNNNAVALTIPPNAVAAMIQADGGTVRVTLDGLINPTSTVGTRIDDGVMLYIDSVLAGVKLIAQGGTTTNVQIAYFDKA